MKFVIKTRDGKKIEDVIVNIKKEDKKLVFLGECQTRSVICLFYRFKVKDENSNLLLNIPSLVESKLFEASNRIAKTINDNYTEEDTQPPLWFSKALENV